MKVCSRQTILLVIALCAVVESSTGGSASKPPIPFPTWSFASPSRHMEWNSLPSHVKLSTTVDDSVADVCIVGVVTNTTTKMDAVSDENDDESLRAALSLLQEEVKDSPSGTLSSSTLWMNATSGTAQQLYCLQLGNLTTQTLKAAGSVGTALAIALGKRQKHQALVRVVLPPLSAKSWTELASSFWTALYKDERYKGPKSATELEKENTSKTPVQIQFVVLKSDDDDDKNNDENKEKDEETPVNVERALSRGASLARGVYMSKDIVNAPHNILNAISLAETAERLCYKYRSVLSCQILSAAECERRGMGAFLGVARASETEAQFLHVTYKPPRRHGWTRRPPTRKLGVVGKGLLFDTGGYNIKTAMMELMKFDCGGAAAVLGAVRAVAELQPDNVEVHFCIAACENMINERGVVPGDVLTASNGKTIEVLNTDAEGRLTMADALVYVDKELECEEIVELSTLTGACMVALGSSVAGLWTSNDSLAERLKAASDAASEKIWRMPLVEEYNEQLKSKIADLKNIGGRGGGAITAALFLQNFVEGKKPFAHIDMAGPVWSMKQSQATGWGAKLLTEWIHLKSEEHTASEEDS